MNPQELERLFCLFGLVSAQYAHPGGGSLGRTPIDDCWPFLTSKIETLTT